MSFNTSISLPPQTQMRDVALVLAALDGIPTGKGFFKTDTPSFGLGAQLTGGTHRHISYGTIDSLPECVHIQWTSHWGRARHVLYHFEFNSGAHRGMLPPSTPWWIAAAKRLVDVFGGIVDYNDCDDHDQDYMQPIADDISATQGDAWGRWQERLLAVTPLTDEEIKQARIHAAYKEI